MVYVPNYGGNWQTGVGGGTPITEAALDNLETQYQEVLNLFNAQTILIATLDNTPLPLTVGASRIVGRKAAGNIVALTGAELMVILSGQAGADFSMNTHKITSVTDPGANQDAATKKYHDDNLPTVTKEIYAEVDLSEAAATPDLVYGGYLINGGTEKVSIQLLVPHDFTAITNLEVIFITRDTGASMHFKFVTYFGAVGEAYNNSSETGDNRDIGATVDGQFLAHDIADLTTGLAAGDRLNITVEYNATAIDSLANVCGLRLRYS